MKRLIFLILKLFIATAVALVLLMVGVVFTTVMYQSQLGPGDMGRTWQDIALITTVIFLYLGYVIKAIIDFFKIKKIEAS